MFVTRMRVPFGLAVLSATLWSFGAVAAGAQAARVVVLDRHGRASVRYDQALQGRALTPRVGVGGSVTRRSVARSGAERTVRSELLRLYRQELITQTSYRGYAASFNSAVVTAKRLRGTRAAELEAVIENLHNIAAARMLTVSRLPALFLTLDRNRQWWRSGPLSQFRSARRVCGLGHRLGVLPRPGNRTAGLGQLREGSAVLCGRSQIPATCRQMVAELIPLAANRAGGLVWEYYFRFDGGVPPWTSAMSQGTALQTLADAYKSFGGPLVPRHRAQSATRIQCRSAEWCRHQDQARDAVCPVLVRSGAKPKRAQRLFAELDRPVGLRAGERRSDGGPAIRSWRFGGSGRGTEFDTGAWSLYQPGEEDSLDYHVLVTGFLQQLCKITQGPRLLYDHVELQSVPEDAARARGAHRAAASPQAGGTAVPRVEDLRVGVTLVLNGRTVFQTSAHFTYGDHAFALPVLTHAGRYTVTLDATDLAGNYSSTTQPLRVTR